MNKPEHTIFVGRDEELQELMELARQAFAGQAGVVFVTGEAGIGKTYLVEEFFGRLRKEYTSVVIASGQCSIQSASYLPFHAILEDLLESQKQVTVSGKKLRQVAEVVVDTIWNVGPDLIGVFGIPVKMLQTVADKLGLRGKKSATALEIPKDLDQVKIFGWYTKVMKDIAAQVPLVLFLDDLHWADDSSLNLLLHLGRELENQRLLVIGSYRPHGVAPNSLLQQVKTKLGRYGARELSLDVSEEKPEEIAKATQFVHDYLIARYDTNFSDTFLQILADRIEGNALFLSEILKNLEEQRHIMPGENQAVWQLTAAISHIDDLPEKVEHVLSERVNRLEDSLREILNFASVEGDEFIAQVIAKVRHLDEWQLIDDLTEKLMKIHQLIYERGTKSLASGQYVDEFVFKHHLIREHVYAQLPNSKKRRIHARIGECLEQLYEPTPETIATQLAVHFTFAHVLDKAVKYCLKAAQDANMRYGASEAVHFGKMGLEALKQQANALSQEEYAEKKVRLLLELAKAEEFGGNPQEKKDHIQAGIEYLENHLHLLVNVSEGLRAEVYVQLGELYEQQKTSRSKAKEYLERALAIYERCQDQKQMAKTLYMLSKIYAAVMTEQNAILALERSLTLARQVQDAGLEARCLIRKGWKYIVLKKGFSYIRDCTLQALTLLRSTSKPDKYAEIDALQAIGALYGGYAKFKTGIKYLEQGRNLAQQVGSIDMEVLILDGLGHHYGHYIDTQELALSELEKSLDFRKRVGYSLVSTYSNLGWTFTRQGKWVQAKRMLEQAIGGIYEREQVLPRFRLGRLYRIQEKYTQAEQEYNERFKITEKYYISSLYEAVEWANIAQNYVLMNKPLKSREFIQKVLPLLEIEMDPRLKMEALYELAETYRLLEELETAKTACQQSLDWYLTNGDDPERLVSVAEARLVMGKILVDMGEYREAITYLEKARAAFEVCEHYALGETLLYLGKAHQGLGGAVFLHDAKTYINQALAEFQRLELSHKAQEAQDVLRSLA